MNKPANFREVDFNIGGKAIKIAGMARPDYSSDSAPSGSTDSNDDIDDLLAKLGLTPNSPSTSTDSNNDIDNLLAELGLTPNSPSTSTDSNDIDDLLEGLSLSDTSDTNPKIETNTNDSMDFLKSNEFNIIISLNPKAEYEQAAKERGIEYHSMYVEDFTTPNIQILEKAFDIVSKATQEGKKVAVHCGEGFGRTGTVLAGIKLKTLMLNSTQQLKSQKKTAQVHIGEHGGNINVTCTPLVKQAIEEVRSAHGGANSIETKDQIKQLIKYEKYLLPQILKKKNHNEGATLSKGKFHLLGANTENFKNIKEELRALKGDALKKNILLGVKGQLNSIESKEQLKKFKQDFKSSDEYKILNSAQGVTTKLLDLKTSSIKAFDQLIQVKEQELDSPKFGSKPS